MARRTPLGGGAGTQGVQVRWISPWRDHEGAGNVLTSGFEPLDGVPQDQAVGVAAETGTAASITPLGGDVAVAVGAAGELDTARGVTAMVPVVVDPALFTQATLSAVVWGRATLGAVVWGRAVLDTNPNR